MNVERIDQAIAVAFNALQAEALKLGLPILPVEGLAELSDIDLLVRFKRTCKAVILSLENEKPSEEKEHAGGKR